MKKFAFVLLSAALMLSQISNAQIVTFNYTGGSQNYVVPGGVTVICFTVSGAQGMRNAQGSNLGGLGGRVTGSMPVTPGQVLQINVGGGGLISSAGGFNGGGNGGIITTACCNNAHAGGGGGASDIRIAPYALTNRVAVGGGGGGTGGNRVVGCAPGTGGGGGGGYFGGGGGGAYGGSPGGGGSQVAGGGGGASCCGCPLTPQPGGAGALGFGGYGGNLGGCNNQAANNNGCAGGIGGALVGGIGPNCTGGTGCPSTWAGASGGGGSNFAAAIVIGPAHLAGVQAGHGQVIIQPNCCATPTIVPVANPNPICAGNIATLTATGAGTGGTYTWTPGPITGSQVTVSPSVTTIYTVSGSNTLNCVGTQTIQLNVNPLPIVTPNNNSPVCSGGTINLTVNAANSYTWAGPNGFSSNLQNPSITNASTVQSGNYTVAVTNANGCTNTAVTSVTVNPTPTITAGNTGPYCAGATISLSVSAANNYAWAGPNGFTSNLQNPTIANSQTVNSGIYNVTITLATGCTATGATTVLVNPSPNPTITSNSPVCLGSQLNLFGLGGTTYTWTGPNNFTSTAQNPSIPTTSLVNGGNYTLAVTNNNGCTNTVVTTIVINTLPIITVNNPTICLGSGFTLTATGGTAFIWVGPNAFTSAQQNPVFTSSQLNMSGNYTVLATSGLGCTNTAISNVSVIPLPTVSVLGTNTLCSQNFNGSPNSVVLTAGGAANYTWTLPGGFSAVPSLNTNIITLSPPVTAVQSVATMSVLGMTGTCTNSAVYSITVMPNPTITVTSASMCAGFSANLSVSGASTYSWSPSTALSSTNSAVVIANPSVTTLYSIIGSNAGCKSQTGNATASVVPNPTVSIAPGSPTICFGNAIGLTAGGANNYSWSPNTAITATTGANVTVSPTVNTTYFLIGEQATCTGTTAITVTIVPLPVVNIAISSPTLCANNFNNSVNTVTITASGANTYNWISFSNLTPNTTVGAIINASAQGPGIGSATVIGSAATCTNMSTFTVAILSNPVISVTSASMCLGTSATLTASGAVNYQWSPNINLSSNTGSTVVANPNVDVIYSVFGSSGGCNSASQSASVNVVPLPVINISPQTATMCAGTSVALNASGATTYTWLPSNSVNNPFNPIVMVSPIATTNYTVIGSIATCTSSAIRQVSVIALPTLQALVSPLSICQGDQATINANGANNYTWSPGTGLNDPYSNFVTANPNQTTIYTLIGNNGICSASLQVTLYVAPKPNTQLTASSQKICEGNSSTIFVAGADSYSWSPLSSLTLLNAGTAIANPSVSTNYTVIGINYAGTMTCVHTKEIFIEVVPTIAGAISGSVQICEGESVKLYAGGSNTYQWHPSSELSNPNVPQPYANPKSTTVYTVFISNNGNCAITKTVLVKVVPQPTVYAGRDTTFNLDEPMYLNAKGTGTLTWIAGEGILCKDCPNTQIMPKNSGCYTIKTVNGAGCTATDEVCVEITKEYNIYIPNSFTPNFDGINDVFRIHGTGISNLELYIFDRWGERLYFTKEFEKGWDGTYKGEMSKEDTYVYLVNFTTLSGKIITRTGHVTLMK